MLVQLLDQDGFEKGELLHPSRVIDFNDEHRIVDPFGACALTDGGAGNVVPHIPNLVLLKTLSHQGVTLEDQIDDVGYVRGRPVSLSHGDLIHEVGFVNPVQKLLTLFNKMRDHYGLPNGKFGCVDRACRRRGPLMNKKDLLRFKTLLEERKGELESSAESLREGSLGVEQEELPDELDQASSEAGQSMNLRLRDREVVLLRKIEKALRKIDEGEFGICEECGEEIGVKRLEARPVADLCVRCKEEQERREKGFAE